MLVVRHEPGDLTLKSHWPAVGLQEGQLTARVSLLGLESSLVDVEIPRDMKDVQCAHWPGL